MIILVENQVLLRQVERIFCLLLIANHAFLGSSPDEDGSISRSCARSFRFLYVSSSVDFWEWWSRYPLERRISIDCCLSV